MKYFNEYSSYRRPSWLTVVILLIVAAIAGGLLSLYIASATGMFDKQDGQSSAVGSNGGNATENKTGVNWQADLSNISDIADQVAQSVVCIETVSESTNWFFGNQEVTASGSGLIYSSDGYIITNNHVVAGAKNIVVTLADGNQEKANVIGTDTRSDLALIKIPASGLKAAEFGDSDKVAVGNLALVIGNPGGEQFARSVTMGIISGLNRQITTSEGSQFELIQTDAAINPGNSGGPLVNSAGQVIGITSVKIISSEFEGMGFAIPSNTVLYVIKSLFEHGYVIRPVLEVYIYGEVNDSVADDNDLSVNYGVIVTPIDGGAADKAGIKQYDIIIAIDENKVATTSDLQEIIYKHKIGDSVKVTVMRDNKEQSFNVVLQQTEE